MKGEDGIKSGGRPALLVPRRVGTFDRCQIIVYRDARDERERERERERD